MVVQEQTICRFPAIVLWRPTAELMQKNDRQKQSECKLKYHGSHPQDQIASVVQWCRYALGWKVKEEEWWTTIYAAFLLLEAKRPSFWGGQRFADLRAEIISLIRIERTGKLMLTITTVIRIDRNYFEEVAIWIADCWPLAGKDQCMTMNYYKISHSFTFALDSRYLHWQLYLLLVISDSFGTMAVILREVGKESSTQTGGSFYSDVRDGSNSVECAFW